MQRPHPRAGFDVPFSFLRLDKVDEAIAAFKKLNMENDIDVQIGIARCHQHFGRYQQALNILHALALKTKQRRDLREIYLAISFIERNKEDHPKVEAALNACPDQNDRKVLLARASFYVKLHRYDEAARITVKLKQMVLTQTQQESLTRINRILMDQKPSLEKILSYLKEELGRPEPRINSVISVIKSAILSIVSKPNDSELIDLWHCIGYAVRISPGNMRLRSCIPMLHMQLHNYDEALKLYAEYYKVAPREWTMVCDYIHCLAKSANYAASIQLGAKILKLDNASVSYDERPSLVHFAKIATRLANNYLQLCNWKMLKFYAELAIKYRPEFAPGHMMLGRYYNNMNNNAEAHRCYAQARLLTPKLRSTHDLGLEDADENIVEGEQEYSATQPAAHVLEENLVGNELDTQFADENFVVAAEENDATFSLNETTIETEAHALTPSDELSHEPAPAGETNSPMLIISGSPDLATGETKISKNKAKKNLRLAAQNSAEATDMHERAPLVLATEPQPLKPAAQKPIETERDGYESATLSPAAMTEAVIYMAQLSCSFFKSLRSGGNSKKSEPIPSVSPRV